MSPPVSRCHFDFVNDRKVTASVGLHELTDMELASEGTAYETLMALSVYVMSTPLGGTWPRLIEMLGRHLFEFLLPDKEIRSQVVGMCANGRVHITLSFQPKAHRYAQLPWEFMSVPLGSDWRFLGKIGREVSITLTRHVPVQSSISTLTRPIKVLVDVTSPKDKTKVDSRLLEAKLKELQTSSNNDFDVRVEYDRSQSDIKADLEDWRPNIYHWSGHGTRDALWLAGEQVDMERVESDRRSLEALTRPLGFQDLPVGADPVPFRAPIAAVVELFRGYAPPLVVLDACRSDWSWQSTMLPGIAHQLVEFVPAVVAMRYPISNGAAATFACELYEGIATGKPLDEAVQAARNALSTDGKVDRAFGTPVLYLKTSMPLCETLIIREEKRSDLDQGRHDRVQPFPCVNCTKLVRRGRPFCAFCGTRYQCGSCNSWFDLTEVSGSFCPACGTRNAGPAGPKAPPTEAVDPKDGPPPLENARKSQLSTDRGTRSTGAAAGFPGFRGARDSDTDVAV